MITVIYCGAPIPTAYLGPAESDKVSRTTFI